MKGLIVTLSVLLVVTVDAAYIFKEWNVKNAVVLQMHQAVVKAREMVLDPAPENFDWRKSGVVPPVRNQGMLGTPYVFAATAAVESYHAIHTGNLVQLSISEMVDCCVPPMQPVPGDVFGCVHRIGGLCSQSAYPAQTGRCNNDSCQAAARAQVNGGHIVPRGDEQAMLLALWKSGPVVVLVDASRPSFQEYNAGIYADPDCSKTMVDHALLLVGYGVDKESSEPYWICQNSWGASWGEQGYIRIKRGSNMCAIATLASYPY